MTHRALTTILLLASGPLPAQLNMHTQLNAEASGKPRAYVSFAAEPQSVPAGKHAYLELRFHIQPGYHVNSHTPKSDLQIATTLTLQPTDGVKAGPLTYPAGQTYSFSFDPSDKLDVYAGDFTLKLPVVATTAGAHTIDGSLRYQACDNASCYAPYTLPIQLVFTAK
jgi:DsbC/DsbD-like thiol-disulfide interchange protein